MQSYQCFQVRGGGGVTLSVNKYNIMREIEDLNASKANTDADNFTQTGKANIVSLCMPDYDRGVKGVIAAWTTVEQDCLVVAGATLRGKTAGEAQGMEYLSLKNSSGQLIPTCSVNDNGWISTYQSIFSDGYVTVQAFIPKGYSYYYHTGCTESQGIMVYPLKGAV